MRLPFAAVERVSRQLRQVSSIVDLQSSRAPGFVDEVVRWLAETEHVLNEVGATGSSALAALRTRLLTTVHGVGLEPGVTRRKASEAAASTGLAEGQRIVSAVLQPDLDRFAEAEGVVHQLVAVLRAKGHLGPQLAGLAHDAALQQVLAVLRSDADTAAATAHVQGLLGLFDTLVVLDRALPELV